MSKSFGKTALDWGIYIVGGIDSLLYIVELFGLFHYTFTTFFIPYTVVAPYNVPGLFAAGSMYFSFDFIILVFHAIFRLFYIVAPVILVDAYVRGNISATGKAVAFGVTGVLIIFAFLLEIFKQMFLDYIYFFKCSSFWFCVNFDSASAAPASISFYIVIFSSLLWLLSLVAYAFLLLALRQTVIIHEYQDLALGTYEEMKKKPTKNIVDNITIL
jgi:hypothetical protein